MVIITPVKVDVTTLLQNFSDGVNLTANPSVYGNGNGTYAVGDAYADTQSDMYNSPALADAGYGGWSLIIIYSSPETLGHQLYIYNLPPNFPKSVPNQTNGGPTVISEPISGFIVPDKISGERNNDDVAKMTVFVGEGDIGLPRIM